MKRGLTWILISLFVLHQCSFLTYAQSTGDTSTNTGDTETNIVDTPATFSAQETDTSTQNIADAYEEEFAAYDTFNFDVSTALDRVRELQASVELITDQLMKLDAKERTDEGISEKYRETRKEIVSVINDITATTEEVEKMLRQTALYKKEIETLTDDIKLVRDESSKVKEYLEAFTALLYKANNHLYSADQKSIDEIKLILFSDNIARTLANEQLITSMVAEFANNIEMLQSSEQQKITTLRKLIELRAIAKSNVLLYNQELDTLEQKRNYLMQFLELYQNDRFASIQGISTFFESRKSVHEAINTLLQKITNKKYGVDRDMASLLAEVQKNEKDKQAHVIAWPLYPIHTINTFFGDEQFREDYGFAHEGIQIAADQDTPIYAARDGVVYHITDNDTIGINWMMIIHTDGYVTVYTYMNKTIVKPGDIVQRGQLIGYSGGEPGTRGAGFVSPGANLTFGVYRDGQAVDPLKLLDISIVSDKEALPSTYHIKFLRDKYARPIDVSDLTFASGSTADERATNFLKNYGIGVYRSLNFWNNAVNETNIDRDVVVCIAFAESTLGRYLSTSNNIGNVGNNDRGDRFAFNGALAGARAIAQTLNNQHLGDYHTINQLSRYGNSDGKIYASSPINWQTNVLKCLSQIKGYYIPEDFPFRTGPNPNKDEVVGNETPAAKEFDWTQTRAGNGSE